MIFPKLKYPILTKGIEPQHRLIILAYDMLFRLRSSIEANMEYQKIASPYATNILGFDEKHDLDANLANLGYYIEHTIFNGDCTAVFEPDSQIEFTSNLDEVAEKE